MTIRKFWEREKYVAIHAQTWKFRLVKYIVLLGIGYGVYQWGGWIGVFHVFIVLFVVAIAIHFLFRWKTKAWTKDWGPYKALNLPK